MATTSTMSLSIPLPRHPLPTTTSTSSTRQSDLSIPSNSSTPINEIRKRKRPSPKGATEDKQQQQQQQQQEASNQSRPNRYPCNFDGCNKSYSKPSRLKEHERSHTGERPFKCNHKDCLASYMRNSHLVAHKRTHLDHDQGSTATNPNPNPNLEDQGQSGESSIPIIRPFACQYQGCSQRFWTRQHLNRHVAGVHDDDRALQDQTQTETEIEDGWTTHSSETDGRRSKKRTRLDGNGNDNQSDSEGKKRRRRKRPGGEGAYKCSIQGCGDTFSKRKHLRAHVWSSHSLLGSNPRLIDPHGSNLPLPAIATAAPPPNPMASSSTSLNPDPDSTLPPIPIHVLPFQCTHQGCLKRFPTNAKRKQHLRTHQVGRYACSLDHDSNQLKRYLKNWREANGNQKEGEDADKDEDEDGSLASVPEEPFPNILYFETWSKLRTHMKSEHKKGKRVENTSDLEDEELEEEVDDEEDQEDQQEEEDPERVKEENSSNLTSKASKDSKIFQCTYDLDHIPAPSSNSNPTSTSNSTTNQNSTSSIPLNAQPSSSSTSKVQTQTQNHPPCEKCFTRLSALRTHIKVFHLGEKRFICPNHARGCEKRYAYRHLLRKHEGKCWFRVEEKTDCKKKKSRKTRIQKLNSSEIDDVEDKDLSGIEGDSETREEADDEDEEGEEEEEDENDFFRKEGGAVPEKHASRQAIVSTKEWDRKKRNGLLERLTGSGYDPLSFLKRRLDEEDDQEGEGEREREGVVSKKRKLRGRILKCPWLTISEVMKKIDDGEEDQDDEDGDDGEGSSGSSSEKEEKAKGLGNGRGGEGSKDCLHRFSRMYDLRRHVKASHGLDLTEKELKAFIPLEVKSQLPRERRKD